MGDPYRIAKEYLAKRGESPLPPADPPFTELAASQAEFLATLDVEEALFRVYWRTLPDPALARSTWPAEVIYFSTERGLHPGVYTALARRVRDLRNDEADR